MGPNFICNINMSFIFIPSPQALEAHRLISSVAHQVHSWAPTVICNINMSFRFIFIPSPQALEARRFILIFASPGSLMGPNFHLQHQHVFHLHPQAQIP